MSIKAKIDEFLALPNDSTKKTVGVALALCLVCAVAVSTTAVALKPIQDVNKTLNRKQNIIDIGQLAPPGTPIDEAFKNVEAKVVDLQTGEYVNDIDPEKFDARAAAIDPKQNVVLTREQDIASIKRRAKYATVYLVKENDQLKKVILPVSGYGLWSTLYGFLALEGDLNTVVGLGFYEQAETAGLGGEVDNPMWKAKWPGKTLYDEQGNLVIQVTKTVAPADDPRSKHQVDALSGATLTSNGVNNLLHFWLGKDGFGPYLQKLRNGGGA
ncbi:Na(+)-translocating NADH-quinone reductase subunit C [Thiofilum flexile]|uniref:Na(+)-translocating NADH-quinone reductase subunit C n=1 Tax=Thiofilum flexile TaxID=125627 RepID=UPI00036CA6ED|nr:Na(+)-translocating NADH-quinone reductase subunit C [Thiofilum flexile]